MGDDGETFSSSGLNDSEQHQQATGEEKLNGGELNDVAEQCELVPKSYDSNVSPFDLKGREGLAEMEAEEEKAAQGGGIVEAGEMHGADDVEDKMGAEEEVGGGGEGGVLTEMVGGENSDFTGVDEAVMNEGGHVEVLAVQPGSVVAPVETEEVVDPIEFKEGAINGVDGENSDSNMGVSVERSHDTVVDEVEAVVVGEKLITESDSLQPTAADGSGTVEEDAETVVTPVESSLVMTGAEKEVESAEDEEANVEEMLTAKLDAEVTEEESNAESVTELQGLEFVGIESSSVPKEEMNQMGGKEGVVADTVMDHTKETEELEKFRSTDLRYSGQESDIAVDDEARKKWFPGGIPVTDPIIEEGKEAVTEASKVCNVESIRKPDDADPVQQDDENAEMVAEEKCDVTDMGVEIVTDLIEGIGKAHETETVDVGEVESIPNTDDVKLVPQDEDKKMVANDEPCLIIGSEMETKTDAGDEPRMLVLEQEEAETRVAEVGNVVSIHKTDDVKLVSLDQEDGEMVAEEGADLAGMELETQTGTGEEQRLLLEKEKEAETETAEDNVEYTPQIDDSKDVPQDEGDEEMAAEEESALADTEMETETDVGESSRAVGDKHKRGRNSKVLTNSKTLSKARKIMEEDVCFICFDGGDLVLCDRR